MSLTNSGNQILDSGAADPLNDVAVTRVTLSVDQGSSVKSKRRPRRMWPKFLKLTRRMHLYFGLALLPWVLLYGVTALLFNHSDWFSASERWELSESELSELPAMDGPEPLALAGAVVAQLRDAGEAVELIEESVQWVGSYSFQGKTSDDRLRVTVDPEGRGGVLRRFPSSDEEPDHGGYTVPVEVLAELGIQEKEAASDSMTALLAERGIEATEMNVRRSPRIEFVGVRGDEFLRYELELGGDVTVESAEQSPSLRTRLLRLHLQHGNPGFLSAKSLWSNVVDIVGIAMILWALTGLVMWWSIRPTRRTGWWAIVAGVASMSVLALTLVT